jgi:hypothetical protein
VFHFNKGHLTDPSIPMWVLKTKGESYYVNHVDCSVPWSTKETPDNPSTKGSLRVKNCLMVIDKDNNATLSPLTPEDRDRLNGKKEPMRLITSKGYQLKQALANHNIQHSTIKHFGGGCGTSWFVIDISNEKDFIFLSLTVDDIRKLMPNEYYYTAYADKEDDEGEEIECEEELYDN